MQYLRARLVRVLLSHFGPDDRRIDHALRVLFHAERLMPEYPGCDPDIVLSSALLHDVGIKRSEELHGYNTGLTQEQYGPPVVGELLESIGFPSNKIPVVQDIVGNHHSPSRFDYPELALLKAADLVVNRADSAGG